VSLGYILVSASLMFCQSTIAYAEEQSGGDPDPQSSCSTAPPPQGAALEEIVVTAQKRVQKINDVGLTIQSIGGQKLKDKQINSLADLAQAVLGLSFTQSGFNTPVYTLRGVGFYEKTTLGAYPDVSTYLDEGPLPFPVLTKLTGDLQLQVITAASPLWSDYGRSV
jgi:outer membrane receptor protein involved in Fe transport